MRTLKPIALIVTSVAALAGGHVHSETVRIPVGQQADNVWSGNTPSRGQTKSHVEATFGSPDSTHGPKGVPPIYYWEYNDFTVYFESDHVLHVVVKHRPKVD